MARIRTVKPEFWTHPVMGRIDDSSKCLALALLNFADDEGYFLSDPNLVRSSCRPFDDDSTTIRRCLSKLIESGWIEVRNHPSHGPVGVIVNFEAHQKIDRPKPSSIKAYFVDDDSTIDRRTITVGREGNGKEGKGNGTVPRVKPWMRKHPEEIIQATQEILSFWPDKSQSQPKKGESVPESHGPLLADRLARIKSEGGDLTVCIAIAGRAVEEFRAGGVWMKAAENWFGKSDGAPWQAYYQAHLTNQEVADAS